MTKFTYLFLELLLFSPVLFIVTPKYKTVIKKYKKLLFIGFLLSIIAYFLLDLSLLYFNVYSYNVNKTLDIKIYESVIETMFYSIAAGTILTIVVAAKANEEQKGKRFTWFLKRKSSTKRKK